MHIQHSAGPDGQCSSLVTDTGTRLLLLPQYSQIAAQPKLSGAHNDRLSTHKAACTDISRPSQGTLNHHLLAKKTLDAVNRVAGLLSRVWEVWGGALGSFSYISGLAHPQVSPWGLAAGFAGVGEVAGIQRAWDLQHQGALLQRIHIASLQKDKWTAAHQEKEKRNVDRQACFYLTLHTSNVLGSASLGIDSYDKG